MIERYPKSSKLLRSYGRFLEEVRNDPWRAQRYFSEAERIDDEASYEVDSVGGSDNDDDADLPTDMNHVDDKKYAVVVIKPTGVIRIANPKIEKLFGYKSGELVGKNVNVLMPQPYSSQHNGYLKRYMATGKGTIMGTKQKLQGRHKKGHVFPINLLVSKVPGGPSADDVNFMGEEEEAHNLLIIFHQTTTNPTRLPGCVYRVFQVGFVSILPPLKRNISSALCLVQV